MVFKNLKGFKDYYPEEFKKKEYILNIFNEVSISFGYIQYDGPIIEEASLYEAKSGESLLEEVYSFTDRGDRRVILRPEMTPTLARMLAEKSSQYKKPIRWFSVPDLFRNEKPQKARSRQFTQYNADIIGANSNLSEIEILNISINILERLGFSRDDFDILINNRDVAFKFLSNFTEDVNNLLRVIDKKGKIKEEDFNRSVEALLKDKKFLKDVLVYINDSDSNKFEEIKDITDKARDFGLSLKYDPSIVRGLDYYTSTVFEIWDKKRLIKRSLFGGGRYSDLISSLGGEDIVAVGIACSIEGLTSLIKEYNKEIPSLIEYDYFILTFGNVELSHYSNIANTLRSKGYSVLMNISEDWNISKQIEFALKMNVKNLVILGEKELENKSLIIKNLKLKKESIINIKDLENI